VRRALFLAVALVAAACDSHDNGPTLRGPAAQTLRTCVDRWNQGNMRDWTSANALVGVHGRCFVRYAAGQSTSWTCTLDRFGAYYCPLRHEGDRVPVVHPNATLDGHGVLTLNVRLHGTHPPPRLPWQRYPRTDGWVDPWTRSGTFREGLRFTTNLSGGGDCVSQSELIRTGIRCLWRGLYQVDPCYAPPGRWNHRGGVVACPNGPGATTFQRFVIGPPSYRAIDFPIIEPWDGAGAFQLDEPRKRVAYDYDAIGHRYHVLSRRNRVVHGYYVLHHSRVYIDFRNGHVDRIDFTTPYYRSFDGIHIGRKSPALKMWHGFLWDAWKRGRPCRCWVKVGYGDRSLPATPANFGKPWVFLYVRNGRVARIDMIGSFAG
jgi:hypothetical protein